MSDAKTLHETLRCDRGHDLGVLTAGETWAELRARGLVTGEPS